MNKELKQFFGFTLAEVLITLSVIGVVAAITIPALVQNYKKIVWTNQLKKSYTTLQQSFTMMLAHDGVSNLMDTSVWDALRNKQTFYICKSNNYTTSTICKNFGKNLGKYFNNSGFHEYVQKYYLLNGDISTDLPGGTPMFLSDGSAVFFELNINRTKTSEVCNIINSYGGHMCSTLGYIYIDVNGIKRPNTWGRDIFLFVLSQEGKLYPAYGKDNALCDAGLATTAPSPLDRNNHYWKNNTKLCGSSLKKADYPTGQYKDPKESWGVGCAARIIENNWKMDY